MIGLFMAGVFSPAAGSAQDLDGQRLFRQRCAGCHSLESGRSAAGPRLDTVIGREAGSVEGARYSDAMRNASIIWSAETLETFLSAPVQMVPGTRMRNAIPNKNERAAIIGYLQNLSSEEGDLP
ncbi:c-type cytochrome [Brucella sp. BE17]|uniref:c-type cytochrome n=1 Tax=Brucella sp. BE17 TaxID=3142977 RepID=UPI0031BB739A